jgi:hypothetical protein
MMKLIDNWQMVAKKSIVMWLWYLMTFCMAGLTTINIQSLVPAELLNYIPLEDVAAVIPPDVRHFLNVWLLRAILACAFFVGPSRLAHQPAIAPKPPE